MTGAPRLLKTARQWDFPVAMPPVSATRRGRSAALTRGRVITAQSRSVRGAICPGTRRHLGIDIAGRRNPLLNERVPFMALRTLPEKLGAAIPASCAHMRIQVEHRQARRLDVSGHERAGEIHR